MQKSLTEYAIAREQSAKLSLSLFEYLKERNVKVKNLSKELSILEDNILEDLEENGKISRETEKSFYKLHDIIGTVADKLKNKELLDARQKVINEFHPDPPYDFPIDFGIIFYLKRYRYALEEAVAGHTGDWEEFLKKQGAESLKSRDEDILQSLSKVGKAIKGITKE